MIGDLRVQFWQHKCQTFTFENDLKFLKMVFIDEIKEQLDLLDAKLVN
jgi:hypothetical protein